MLNSILTTVREKTGVNQWRSTDEALNWFDGLSNKTNLTFLTFDIVEFYPSITETILRKALEFAKEHTTIKDIEIDAILNARQTLMFKKGKTWSKRNASNCFDVAMESYDGAEICEFVGLFVLDQLKKIVPRQNIGLYRDDGLAAIESTIGPKADKTRKDIIEIFKTIGLKITIEANLKAVDFLDVTLNLDTGLYQPYRKPNDQTRYVHTQSNHPPAKQRTYQNLSNNDYRKFPATKKYLRKQLHIINRLCKTAGTHSKLSTRKKDPNESAPGSIHHSRKTSKRTSPGDFSKCSTNISRIIKNHNNRLTNEKDGPNQRREEDRKDCNCRNKQDCPMDGNC